MIHLTRPARPTASLVLTLTLLLAACANPPAPEASRPVAAAPAPEPAAPAPAPAAPPAPPPAAPAPPPPVLPYEEAVLSAANNLLGKAQLAAEPPHPRHTIVVDPLIDGVTGMQSKATQAMGSRIVQLIRERYPQYEVQPFTAANVQKSPVVLIGTFTGVNKDRKTEGKREAFRICLALADLKTGKLVSKGLAFAQMEGVDVTPLTYFRDAPAWTEDPATLGYIRTCQGTKAGDPIHPQYINRIVAATLISEAIDAYGSGRYKEARDLYETVVRSPEGQQARVYSGLYLANWRLGHKEQAIKAFGQLVEQGLEQKRLGVKFLFRSGSAVLSTETGPSATPYQLWLMELASQASKRQSCMEVTGHASPTGPEPINERLSQLRADHIKRQIERASPALSKRLIANGLGSRETLVGNGRDDASDALDRRVEFKVIGC
ncbi:MAG: OmpA family protein [Burkholderiales bacterium]|nr:OmpA family protein [Burkholderiales bacterium]